MPDRRAGSVGKYNAESPKQDSRRFNSITMTIHFAHLGILFIYDMVPFKEVSLRILKGLEAAVEVVKDVLKQYDSDSSKYPKLHVLDLNNQNLPRHWKSILTKDNAI